MSTLQQDVLETLKLAEENELNILRQLASFMAKKRVVSGFTIGTRILNQVQNSRVCVCKYQFCIWEAAIERGHQVFDFGVEFQNPLIHSQGEPPPVGLGVGFSHPLGSIGHPQFFFFFF